MLEVLKTIWYFVVKLISTKHNVSPPMNICIFEYKVCLVETEKLVDIAASQTKQNLNIVF